MSQVVWNSDWILPYESPWSIFEKFCYANIIKRSEMLKKYGVSSVRKIQNHVIGDHHRNLRTLDGFEDQLLSDALGFDLKKRMKEQLLTLEAQLPSESLYWLRPNLTWCKDCITSGYHSLFHQFALLHHCPIHMTPLMTECPNCNQRIPYLLSDKQLTTPFSCKCGYRLADLSNRWMKWSNATTTIKCSLTQKWLELSKIKNEEINLLFIPEYAMKNKHSMEYLIHAFEESLTHKTERGDVTEFKFNLNRRSWYNEDFNAPNLKTEQPSRLNSRFLLNGINHYTYRKFYDYLHEKSRLVFKSIDKQIRRNLVEHKSCIHRFQAVLKEENKPFPQICPYAYAYVFWKQSVLGYDKFYEYQMGAHKQENVSSFSLVNKYFVEEQKYLLCRFLENTFNLHLEKPWQLSWLVQKITATFCKSFYYTWQQIATYGAEQLLAPRNDSLESMVHDCIPFIVIKYPTNLSSGVPIAYYEYISDSHRKKCEEMLCPYSKIERKINNTKEKVHTPIAYSMRYLETSRFPEEFTEESKYINNYLRNFQKTYRSSICSVKG